MLLFFLMIPPPPRSTLFPYTTLFRSIQILRCVTTASTAASPTGLLCNTLDNTRLRGHGCLCCEPDRKSTRLNSSHRTISYAVFCLKKKNPCQGSSRSAVLECHTSQWC